MRLAALLLGFLLLLLISQYLNISIPTPVVAQTMSNDNYILQLEELDTAADKLQAKDNTLGVSDQEAPEQKAEPKYKIQSGFLHEKSKAHFTFSISESLIYFGLLSPTNPILRSNKLSVSSDPANGYSIIAFEDKELSAAVASDATAAKSDLAAVASLSNATGTFDVPSDAASPSGAIIPDTSCDNGLCSEVSSAPWTSILTYGFGYRCDNIIGFDCVTDFSDSAFYKQFANNSKNETPQKVLVGTNTKKGNLAQITYKVNISGTQAKGSYQNVITYIAVPNF